MPQPPRTDEFVHYDLSGTEPGDRAEYSLFADADPLARGFRKVQVSSVACVAARGEVLYLFSEMSEGGRRVVPWLVEVRRTTGLAIRAWNVLGRQLLAPLSLEPPPSVQSASDRFAPRLTVLQAREKEFRSVTPPVTGWMFRVRSDLFLTPFAENFPPGFLEYRKSVSWTAVLAFSEKLPFPRRTSDSATAARLFMPAAWSERILLPATPVFLRGNGSGPQVAMRLRSWSRGDASLVALGTHLMSLIDHGPRDSA